MYRFFISKFSCFQVNKEKVASKIVENCVYHENNFNIFNFFFYSVDNQFSHRNDLSKHINGQVIIIFTFKSVISIISYFAILILLSRACNQFISRNLSGNTSSGLLRWKTSKQITDGPYVTHMRTQRSHIPTA